LPAPSPSELPSSARRARDVPPRTVPAPSAPGGEPRLGSGEGHAPNCPRFFDTYPWKCDCQSTAVSEGFPIVFAAGSWDARRLLAAGFVPVAL
jgi:hypothetical protein